MFLTLTSQPFPLSLSLSPPPPHLSILLFINREWKNLMAQNGNCLKKHASFFSHSLLNDQFIKHIMHRLNNTRLEYDLRDA